MPARHQTVWYQFALLVLGMKLFDVLAVARLFLFPYDQQHLHRLTYEKTGTTTARVESRRWDCKLNPFTAAS
jgi:hypothetical protein